MKEEQTKERIFIERSPNIIKPLQTFQLIQESLPSLASEWKTLFSVISENLELSNWKFIKRDIASDENLFTAQQIVTIDRVEEANFWQNLPSTMDVHQLLREFAYIFLYPVKNRVCS